MAAIDNSYIENIADDTGIDNSNTSLSQMENDNGLSITNDKYNGIPEFLWGYVKGKDGKWTGKVLRDGAMNGKYQTEPTNN